MDGCCCNLTFFQISEKRPVYFYDTLPQLGKLQARANNIDMLYSFMFVTLPYLTDLDLANNQITVIQAHTFEGLTNLYILSLENNTIKEIDISGVSPSCSINVQKNNFKMFEDIYGLPISMDRKYTYCLAVQGMSQMAFFLHGCVYLPLIIIGVDMHFMLHYLLLTVASIILMMSI